MDRLLVWRGRWLWLAILFVFGSKAEANLILNGDFDTPDIGGSFQTLNSSPPGFGWTVISDGTPNPSATTGILGVDLINTFWTGTGGTSNPDGLDQSVDIDGASSISQSFSTVPGESYNVELSYSHHFGMASSTGFLTIEGIAPLISETLVHSIPNSFTDMQWVDFLQTFVADGPTTTLEIQGVAAQGGFGFAVDNVSIELADGDMDGDMNGIPEPSTFALVALGLAGLGFGQRRKSRA